MALGAATIGAGTALAANALGGLASGMNADSYGYSNSQGQSNAESWNNEYSDSWSSGEGASWSNSWGEGEGYGESWNNAENWGQSSQYGESYGIGSSSNAVYGSEASAKDIQRAKEANLYQDYLLQRQMDYNAKEAEIARQYETLMSNTSYQRAVADLKKAGLNPILAAMNMGATTPVAAYGSSGLATANKATTYADQRGSSYNQSGSYNTGGSSNYGYNKGGSYNRSYQHSGSSSESWNRSSSEGHSRGSGGSYSRSNESSNSYNESKSRNNASALAEKVVDGVGKAFNSVTSGLKTIGEAVGNALTSPIAEERAKGAGKSAFDGYDNPTVSN